MTLADEHFEKGLAYLEHGDELIIKGEYIQAGLREYKYAVRAFKEAIKIDPNHYRVLLKMGHAYNGLSEFETAIATFRKALQLTHDGAEGYDVVLCGMGWAYYCLGENNQAIDCYQNAININSEHEATWNNMGTLYQDLKEFSKALECFQKVVEINPDQLLGWNNLGYIYVEMGELEKALEYFQKALEINPGFERALNNMGDTYHKLEEYQKAIETYEKALALYPKLQYAKRGLKKSRKVYDAVGVYQEVLNNNPSDVDTWMKMGATYEQFEEHTKAFNSYQHATKINPQFEKAWFAMGKLSFFKLYDYLKAAEYCVRAVKINPQSKPAKKQLEIVLNSENYREALQTLEPYRESYELGVVYSLLGKTKDAIKNLQKAITLNSNSVEAWYELGNAYSKKDLKKAIECYERVLKLKPDYEEVRTLLDSVRKRLET